MAEQSGDGTSRKDPQVDEKTSQRQVRLRINEANLTTSYANAFRSNTTAEEVIVDFGMNMMVPNPQAGAPEAGAATTVGDIIFQANNRVVMNYNTTKRLAILLAQIVRRHEDRFGELKLNAPDHANSK